MKVDLSSVIKVTGAEVKLSSTVGFGDAEFLGETYRFIEPLKVEGRVYNNGQSLTLEANVSGRMVTECARCLDEVEADVEFSVHELLSQREEGADEDEDIILFDGYEIELDDIIADHFLMNISGRYLCSDDCKGLCPVCGQNLNHGECDCDNEYIDPRWQALADIMNQTKE
ncbi:MAG: DUF177 domain-containing protein [Clostridia bacterium]|nr:DUF177 domain-containing protein [Clostridia bacterium]MEE0410073.1 DUF177 domain-containing protein [Clostridia bacterium]